jgi:hypothetical protein
VSLWVEVAYRGDWWGEDALTETDYDTTGDLFRALNGRDKSKPWQALGRCTGKVYVDGPPCCGEPGPPRQVGWVFTARNPEPVNRGDEQPTGLREAWVTVKTGPDTVVRTPHFAPFR